MIDPLAALSLPRQRLSLQALVTAGVLHIALLWVMLQSGPVVQAARHVVMQYFSPITPSRSKTTPPPRPAATPVPRPVAVPSPVPRVKTPAPLVEQPPAPIVRTMEAQALERVPVKIQDIKPLTESRRVTEVSTTRIEPLPAALPVLPNSEPAPVPDLPQVPLPDSVAPSVKTPPAPMPDPVVPPAAAPQVPMATTARAAAITPVENASPTTGAAGETESASTRGAMPAAEVLPGGSGLNLIYNVGAAGRGRPKTVAQMANEQLNGTASRDKLAESVHAAEKPDCVNSGQALGILAPIAIAYNVVKDKCK